MQNNVIFHGYENPIFQQKHCDIFLIFCSKHRLLVLVRTAYVFEQKKKSKIGYTQVNPTFNYMKWGL